MLIEAGDESGARQIVSARGLTVLSVKRAAVELGKPRAHFPLQLFSQELLALLQSGLPLVESIETLAEKETRPTVRATLDALLAGLREGRPLSFVLESQPAIFPDLYVAMVRAAERTSDLDQALARYIAYRQQTDALRDKMVSASIYPAMLLGVGGLVVLFLLGYVVPRFSGVFEESGGKLPLASRLLIEWGSLVANNLGVLVGVAAALAVAFVALIRHPAVSAAAGRALWKIPGVGEHPKIFQLARFYRTLAMLLRGGITVLTAMKMARDLLSAALRTGLDAAMVQVREGKGLADSLAANGLTTPVANRMLRVGERAGNLGEMAERIAVFHEEEIGRWVDWLTRLIGPALMLIIGVVIGGIVVLMYLPIFQLAESIQ
ncbi:MAG TPA: type II secretion system F family protein [Rhodocyclaceae bacterium]|nr:type II secretion system F family protein [Rhodocyclaceae bacterium]